MTDIDLCKKEEKMPSLRHVVGALIFFAVAVTAFTSEAALDESQLPSPMTDSMIIAQTLAERSGMRQVEIVGTFDAFACSYGCQENETAIILSGIRPRARQRVDFGWCFARDELIVRPATMRSACTMERI
jgi:hypothetical protein